MALVCARCGGDLAPTRVWDDLESYIEDYDGGSSDPYVSETDVNAFECVDCGAYQK
ncbi:hypothetical protein [Haloglomus halophilum]|jgi:hypothetical protein|uniref:hypothetical protein n=1 Tax=Haloglomus halophilum TaxID=2962672 RepID=UPI0020C9C0C3|nr:hypothetical protein [Haloglomus halophilum]